MTIERHPVKNRGDWLAMRRRDVGASEVAALFGAHPFRSALQVFAEKTGISKGQGDNPAMRRGRIMEPGCIVALEEQRPDWCIMKADEYLRDPTIRIGATPDYYQIKDGYQIPIECKSVAPEKWADWSEQVPLAYQLQVVVQAKLLGAPHGWIALLVDNRAKDFELFEVPAHDAAWERVVERVTSFWKSVDAGQLPKVDYSRDRDVIASIFARKLTPVLDLSGDNLIPALLAERAKLKETAKTNEARLDEIDTEIIAKLEGHEAASLDGWRISFKQQSRKEYTVKAATYSVLRITNMDTKEQAA